MWICEKKVSVFIYRKVVWRLWLTGKHIDEEWTCTKGSQNTKVNELLLMCYWMLWIILWLHYHSWVGSKKCQSPTAVLFRRILTHTITLDELLKPGAYLINKPVGLAYNPSKRWLHRWKTTLQGDDLVLDWFQFLAGSCMIFHQNNNYISSSWSVRN